jgi:hypothetical protein
MMRSRGVTLAVLIVVSASVASAQTSTADGIAALARGDYPQAVEILKPIAEGWRQPQDPAAQFFMASLYETGRGVPLDLLRACALYHRASGLEANPFGAQAARLVRALIMSHMPHDNRWIEDCQLLANVGFDHRFEPVSFTRAPGHSIAWDLKGATVTYEGKSTRFPMRLASRGSIFFAIGQTVLAAGGPASSTRLFNEVFVWQPSGDWRSWSLEWHLFEVVRDQLIRVDLPSDPIVTIQAAEPPGPRSFEVRAYVDVRLTANGEAEWAVLQGPHARTGLIESDAERREVRERDRARSEADKRVDWKKERDAQRPPSMAYVDADGCGSVFVYGWSDDRAEMMTVRADTKMLNLSTAPATFDVARQPSVIEIVIHVYGLPKGNGQFCSDVGHGTETGPGALDETWRAVSGTITIELSPPGVRARSPQLYRATVRISGAEFVNGSGARVRQTQPIALSAIVGGWFGGG